MTDDNRETLAAEIDSRTLQALYSLSEKEGLSLEVLVEEAVADLFEKRKNAAPRSQVLAAYNASHDVFAPLYKKLAE